MQRPTFDKDSSFFFFFSFLYVDQRIRGFTFSLCLPLFSLLFLFSDSEHELSHKFVDIHLSLLIKNRQLIYHLTRGSEHFPVSLFHYTKAGDKLNVWTAFFTASTSISINFPVLDDIIIHFFSSARGTNLFPFSSEQNSAILHDKRNSFIMELVIVCCMIL